MDVLEEVRTGNKPTGQESAEAGSGPESGSALAETTPRCTAAAGTPVLGSCNGNRGRVSQGSAATFRRLDWIAVAEHRKARNFERTRRAARAAPCHYLSGQGRRPRDLLADLLERRGTGLRDFDSSSVPPGANHDCSQRARFTGMFRILRFPTSVDIASAVGS